MTTPTFDQILTKYREDCARIRTLREQAEEAAAPFLEKIIKLEEFQQAREAYIMDKCDVEAFGFITELYLNGRDDKATAKKKAESVGVDMKKLEAWLLSKLRKAGKSLATEFGTVYLTRKESVGVTDFEAYCEAEIFRPMAEQIDQWVQNGNDEYNGVEEIISVLKSSAHLEALTKAANKTFVLEAMGDADEKTGARPNPPPPGVDYKAFATVGVRKPTK